MGISWYHVKVWRSVRVSFCHFNSFRGNITLNFVRLINADAEAEMLIFWLDEISVILTTSGAGMIEWTVYGHIFIWIWRHSRLGVSLLVPQCLKQFSLIMKFNAGWTFKVTTKSVSKFNRAQPLKLIEYFQSVMGDYVSRASLTHCGPETPQGDKELSQHWLRQWLVAWRHQAITRTNVDLSSVRFCGIHRKTLSWEDLKIPISKTTLKITILELHSDLSGPMR